MTRVLVVTGSPVVGAGLAALLAERGFAVEVRSSSAAWAGDTEEGDVVLWDAEPHDGMPILDVPASGPALVLLADPPDAGWIADALRAGARAVLPHDATAEEIAAAAGAAAVGLVTLPVRLAGELLPTPRPVPVDPVDPGLTPRESQVLGLLVEGRGNKGIAARLGISEHTVKAHVASILAKLGARTRTEAVAIGARRGVVLL